MVTIGITCYNAADTIQRAIESALSQDWPNLEILIVDDNSTDHSVGIINKLINNHAQARLILHNTNNGPAAARNTIINEANGEFIAFFDDDDDSFPNRISAQVKSIINFERRKGVSHVACYASGVRLYSNGYKLELNAIGSQGNEAPYGLGVVDYLLLYRRRPDWFYGTGTPACSLLARRNTFRALGGFDAKLRRVEDGDFAIRLALMGGHFIGTPDYLFVQYSTNAYDKSPEKNLEAELALAFKHREYLDSIGCYYYAAHWPQLRYCHFKRRYVAFLRELLGLFIRYPVAVTFHLLATGPRRLAHEHKISR